MVNAVLMGVRVIVTECRHRMSLQCTVLSTLRYSYAIFYAAFNNRTLNYLLNPRKSSATDMVMKENDNERSFTPLSEIPNYNFSIDEDDSWLVSLSQSREVDYLLLILQT